MTVTVMTVMTVMTVANAALVRLRHRAGQRRTSARGLLMRALVEPAQATITAREPAPL